MLSNWFSDVIVGIIGGGAAIVLFLFWAQWYLPRVMGFFGASKASPEERALELMNAYRDENSWKADTNYDESKSSPRIELLRTAHRDDRMTCVFVNRGGIARDFEVIPTGTASASISPVEKLTGGQTGSISLHDVGTNPASVQFQISYRDSLGIRVTRSFSFSAKERTFLEDL